VGIFDIEDEANIGKAFLRSRWQTWCSNDTSTGVMSLTPAADMQRAIQRLNALPAIINAYSSSDNSTLRSEAKCAEDRILEAAPFINIPKAKKHQS
jgi:hypothetical protein